MRAEPLRPPNAAARAAARDRRLVLAAAFVRALATGMIGVLVGVYLAKLGLEPAAIGLVVGAGLAGAALATLVVTLLGDRAGRRRSLLALAVVGAAGGLGLALAATPLVIGLVAFVGMVNGMGRDRGAALVLEQAILPATVADAERTRSFAWYNVLQDAGHALGGLLAGLPVVLRWGFALGEEASLRGAVGVYVLLVLAGGALYLGLSPGVEEHRSAPRARLTPASRRVLRRITALFALDSLGGGFLTTALVSLFFYERFGVDEAALAPLFFLSRAANALSHVAAAWLAARIGLVNTMVFTHIPSSLLLVTVAVAPSFPIAAALFLLREGLVEMDVPTRQSYVMALVRPEERTVASGVTNLVRTGAWAVAPTFAGLFMQGLALGTPLVLGAGMKIAYDVLLWRAFRRIRPPEEEG